MADDQKKPYQEESIGTKLVIIIGAIVGIGAVMYGLYLFSGQGAVVDGTAVQKTRPAAVTSAKAGEVTAEYAGLSTQKDDEQYERAVKQGTSAVPSVIGSAGYISNPSSFAENAEASLKNRLATTTTCSPQYAKQARTAGVNAFELKCQGCQAKILKDAGYTAGELAKGGYSAAELKAAGYTACLLYTSPSPRDATLSRMPSSA